MAVRKPFFTTPDGASYSRSAFMRLPKSEKLQLMLEWFKWNFEDPGVEMPWDSEDKRYLYLWGGPYDAREQLTDMFSDAVSDALYDEAVDTLESDGTVEWAPTTRNPNYEYPEVDDEDGDDHPPESIRLEEIPERPGPAYGTETDHAARRQAVNALVHLQQRLGDRPPGRGHNNPPELIEREKDGIAEPDLVPAVRDLIHELAKAAPEIGFVKRCTFRLRDAVMAATLWLGKKAADKAFEIVVGSAIFHHELADAYNAVLHWLYSVTLPF